MFSIVCMCFHVFLYVFSVLFLYSGDSINYNLYTNFPITF